jgi:hypothetical protein
LARLKPEPHRQLRRKLRAVPFEMHAPLNIPTPKTRQWVCASLTVLDGQRILQPSHAGFDQLYFTQPPRIPSGEIEIVVVNGDAQYRYSATVLPHPPDAMDIPIQLLSLP